MTMDAWWLSVLPARAVAIDALEFVTLQGCSWRVDYRHRVTLDADWFNTLPAGVILAMAAIKLSTIARVCC